MPKPVGRPTVWSSELEASVIKHIEGGATYKDACALAGNSIGTFYEHKADFPEFFELVEAAAVKQKQAHIQNIARNAFGVRGADGKWSIIPDGKLSLSYLQARYPEEFSRHRFEITGANGGPIKVQHAIEVMPIASIESEIIALLPAIEDEDIIDTTTTDDEPPPSTTN
jgi:hypothetical protein